MLVSQSGIKIENGNFSTVLSHRYPAKVIISVPHDGTINHDFRGIFRDREAGVTLRDMHVWPIVNDIVHQCLSSGVAVDAIRFLVVRSYVDVNREMPGEPNISPDTMGQVAFDDPAFESVYAHYHEELDRLLSASVSQHGAENILLLDMHGFSKQPSFVHEWDTDWDDGRIYAPYDIILGTACRTTIRHGDIDRVLARFMLRKRYATFLPKEKPISSSGDPYSAGHITRLYAEKYGINAIQIEIAARFRTGEYAKDAGMKLASDMAEFLSQQYV